MVYQNGTLANDGSITSAGTAFKEIVTTDYIDYDVSKTYLATVDITSTNKATAFFVSFYDSNKNVVGTKNNLYNNETNSSINVIIPKSSSARYIRISTRTYGECNWGLYDITDIFLSERINVIF